MLPAIQQARATWASGCDLPQLAQELRALGVQAYEFFVADGRMVYHGPAGQRLTTAAQWPALRIARLPSSAQLLLALRLYQQDRLGVRAFAQRAAGAGVARLVVSLAEHACLYYGPGGGILLVEDIPLP